MGLEPQLQTKLYEQYWRPMEVDFGQEAYATHFDAFMRHYLTFKTGDIPNVHEVYDAFKQYARSPKVTGVEGLVADVRTFAGYYCAMALGAEKDAELKAAFHDLRELKVDVAYPFLLELYHDHVAGMLGRDELLQVVRLVESYVFRRAVCAIPTNSLNKTFALFGRSLKKDRYVESVLASFLLLPSYRRFPDDYEFKRELPLRDLYNFPRRSYWLRRLENHDRKERVPVDEYTIEHIMPQKEQLTAEWKKELGEEWERIHQTYLHTLGNLTLTGYNSQYGYKPFAEKRDMQGGFKESPLRMNHGLGQLDNWNEETIRNRAGKLAGQAVNVWIAPTLDAAVLDAYKPQPASSGFTIEDHPNLAAASLHPVFEAFRKEVLALDPCVTEEFLKLYVAYKAETNFVDVVPQAKRLRLALNLAFHEIDDPRGICKDVTNIGRWGNGDVEVGLSSLEQLPYVMGLVRQSFEKQMGTDTNP
jgi:predicted transport protein